MIKKTLIFDLDGVLIDSKKNMQISWNKVNKKYSLKTNFKKYFKNIGIPFYEILKKLKIEEKYYKKIQVDFNKFSSENINKVKLYPEVYKVLKILNKNCSMAIVTSKNKTRAKEIIKKFKLPFRFVLCPSKKNKGKPNPALLKIAINKLKANKLNCYYVGDMHVDYITSRRAGIKFIFAEYGYSFKNQKYTFKIKKFKDLLNFITPIKNS